MSARYTDPTDPRTYSGRWVRLAIQCPYCKSFFAIDAVAAVNDVIGYTMTCKACENKFCVLLSLRYKVEDGGVYKPELWVGVFACRYCEESTEMRHRVDCRMICETCVRWVRGAIDMNVLNLVSSKNADQRAVGISGNVVTLNMVPLRQSSRAARAAVARH